MSSLDTTYRLKGAVRIPGDKEKAVAPGSARVSLTFTEADGTQSAIEYAFESRDDAALCHDTMLDLFPCSDCGHYPCGCPNV